MDYENRKPKQLEIKRKAHYDRVYKRQPQLMKRLAPLLNESDIIERNTEPKFLNEELDKKSRVKLRKGVNKFSNKKKERKVKTSKKISEIRPDVLYGMS